MKILQIAPPWFTVPPVGYGGIESVVSGLTEGLVERGYDVTLLASGGSRTSGGAAPEVVVEGHTGFLVDLATKTPSPTSSVKLGPSSPSPAVHMSSGTSPPGRWWRVTYGSTNRSSRVPTVYCARHRHSPHEAQARFEAAHVSILLRSSEELPVPFAPPGRIWPLDSHCQAEAGGSIKR